MRWIVFLAFLSMVVAPSAVGATSIGTIEIPKIGLKESFSQGIGASVLASGPGHYPETGMPGAGRTVALAGHRVTHTHPFRNLDRLSHGDAIKVTSNDFVYTYKVFKKHTVFPWENFVFSDLGWEQLVLTTCTPPGSATQRLVIHAWLYSKTSTWIQVK